MKLELKQCLNYFKINTSEQTYSFETDNKEIFELLFHGDFNETYFEDQPDKIKYFGWGGYSDHGNEFTEVIVKNLGIWFLYYPDTIKQFTEQVNHAIYSEAEAYYY